MKENIEKRNWKNFASIILIYTRFSFRSGGLGKGGKEGLENVFCFFELKKKILCIEHFWVASHNYTE